MTQLDAAAAESTRVTDTSNSAVNSPLQQARPLTAERQQYFVRTAETLAERFEAELARWLGGTSVRVVSADQMMLTNLVRDDTDVAVVTALEHLNNGLVVADLNLVLGLVVGLCGGDPSKQSIDLRPLTRLETGVYDLVLKPIVDQAGHLFRVGEVSLGVHVSTVDALPDAKPEPGIGIRFAVAIGSIEGHVSIGFPLTHLQDYSEEVDRRMAGRLTRPSHPNPQAARAMKPVVVDMVVGFDPIRVPAAHLAGLQVGDVLRTGQSVSKSLVARVGNEKVFTVRAGQRGQRLVAELLSKNHGGFSDEAGKTR